VIARAAGLVEAGGGGLGRGGLSAYRVGTLFLGGFRLHSSPAENT
jgi:hypothetical protein